MYTEGLPRWGPAAPVRVAWLWPPPGGSMAQPERNQLANGAATCARQRQDMDTICQTTALEETSGTDHGPVDHSTAESGTTGHSAAGHAVAARLVRPPSGECL